MIVCRLTPRQWEIVGLVRQGLCNKEISRQLGISTNTVKIHIHAIFQATGVNNRRQLMLREVVPPPTLVQPPDIRPGPGFGGSAAIDGQTKVRDLLEAGADNT